MTTENLSILDGNTFVVTDRRGDIDASPTAPQGLFQDDTRFLSQWVRPGETSWGGFILDTIVNKEVPRTFPLHAMPPGYLPEQLLLTDWPRW